MSVKTDRPGAPPAGVPAADVEPVERVSTLELFFDLVFVFTLTQVTSLLTDRPDWTGALQAAVVFALIWFMYGGYAWLTNAVPPQSGLRRAFLLAGMSAYLVIALTVPKAFGADGLAFGLAYLVVVTLHAALYTRTASEGSRRGMLRLAPFNLTWAVMVLIGGAVGGDAQYALWALAAFLAWTAPFATGIGEMVVAPAHFVERHGLVVIVALGESVVAVGIGAAGLAVDGALVLLTALGLALAFGLWWTYFADGEERRERAFASLPPARRPIVAFTGFGHWHLAILSGIIATASGIKAATGHPFDELATGQALLLGAGVALALAGNAGFRRSLGIGTGPTPIVASALAVATAPLATELAAVAQVAALTAIVLASTAWPAHAEQGMPATAGDAR